MKLSKDSVRLAVQDSIALFKQKMGSRTRWEAFIPIIASLDGKGEAQEATRIVIHRLFDLYSNLKFDTDLIAAREPHSGFKDAFDQAFATHDKEVRAVQNLRYEQSYTEAVAVAIKAYQFLVKSICTQIGLIAMENPSSVTPSMRRFYSILADSALYSDEAIINELRTMQIF